MPEKGTLPPDIPVASNIVYADTGWVGWGDWLGTGTVAAQLRQYRPFEKAREFARELSLKNKDEWDMFCKGDLIAKGTLPSDIPASPLNTYAGRGWSGFGDWLGTGNVAPRLREYRSFNDARDFARSLGLKTAAEWKEFCKGNLAEKGTRPADIPSNPNVTYADKGWISMGEWLGTKSQR